MNKDFKFKVLIKIEHDIQREGGTVLQGALPPWCLDGGGHNLLYTLYTHTHYASLERWATGNRACGLTHTCELWMVI